MSHSGSTLTYVYAAAYLTDALRDTLTDLRGVYGAPVHPLAEPASSAPETRRAPLAFLASHVPADDFNEHDLKVHFEDLEWLEGVARAHNDVVQALATRATVLPLRMATVYQDDDRARQALSRQHTPFTARLDQLDAHTEFGVKIYLAPVTDPAEAPSGAEGPEPVSASPGKAYLQRRRTQQHAVEARYSQAQQAAAALEAIASQYATHRVSHPVQSGALNGPAENVLNDAYLVPDEDGQRFKAAVEEATFGFDGIRVEVTGPWAPYSFAMTPSEEERDAPAGQERRR
ncbi:GvpL/GvpF family gas vesicle protein [Streptomyces sp. NBC_00083]|uniref:GvpL/GvpF family gas vesicle protein n=1 Tax=Streptomyces sp. NBC_00083 TaxID=2975647 RepID=UPI0022553776|nr:GvpL/GvpF family gas vesicle protein [Streptomyces sp. NBC_00083]MCX5384615.1 GvpL/GvpF family gas vesicle protein [Streptomyces sp. NBC_00083]